MALKGIKFNGETLDIPTNLAQLNDDETHRLVSDTEKNTWNNSVQPNALNDYIPVSQRGANDGVASLDGSGKVPISQLPSYVDDVMEFESQTDFPETGEDGKIYVAKDTNVTYRWSGTEYIEISKSLALGETPNTAYAGDKGKANADAINTLQTDVTDLTNRVTTVEESASNQADRLEQVINNEALINGANDCVFIGNPSASTLTKTDANRIAIGKNAYAAGENSIAIGNRARSEYLNSISIGGNSTFASSNGYGTVAIGYNPEAFGHYSISLGPNTSSYGYYSVAIGYGAQTGLTSAKDGREQYLNCVAIGSGAKIHGPENTSYVRDSIQLGKGTNANPKTFQVWDYTLLDGNTGKIPDERLPDSLSQVSADIADLQTTKASKTEIPRPLWLADSVILTDAGIDAIYTINKTNIAPLVATGYTIIASDKIMFQTDKALYLGVVTAVNDTSVSAKPKFDAAATQAVPKFSLDGTTLTITL